ncbi:signal transduction histidine kinase [Roseibium hamelinense]|uniref:histidine kinase n=1 Tax=Roseibium hamelinense TaxID=150831 RepID=A0A562TI68_9HYPH|nr:ATP-binding protein [Roseibium hamelinense]MTI42753.1 HAMP domain-containing protein [Roseibium hamelinense]TWI93399.1 signal transduction histidine kinase [Roseibium hamelinense]
MTWFSWRRLVPTSLAGQLIALLLAAIVAAQAISIWVFHDERRIAVLQVARDNLLTRAISIAELIEETPPAIHDRVLTASSSRFASFWIAANPVVTENGNSAPEQRLRSYLGERFETPREVLLRIEGADKERPKRQSPATGAAENTGGRDWHSQDGKRRDGSLRKVFRREIDLTLSIPLNSGEWLNVATSYRPPPQPVLPLLVQLTLMALAIIVIVGLAARRIARPLHDLAAAAGKLGRGEDIPALKVGGPREVRAVTTAFNDMQDRLTRFVNDRTRMLAAISHDLRTPITSLRLRAEFIEDEENREKIIATLDEMSAMTEATLAFARDEAKKEDAQPTALDSLLESLASDHQDMGHDVSLEPAERIIVTCRPVSLKRALRNLIDNAIRYGGQAELSLSSDADDAIVLVRDNGPGIPDDRLKDVFEPFVRLEESRSEETGGIGLGLAITRSIIHAHGGRIYLRNRTDSGLEAEIRLPRSS